MIALERFAFHGYSIWRQDVFASASPVRALSAWSPSHFIYDKILANQIEHGGNR
jgi:hypothetical protein